MLGPLRFLKYDLLLLQMTQRGTAVVAVIAHLTANLIPPVE